MDEEIRKLLEELRATAARLEEREAAIGDEVKAAVDAEVKELREKLSGTEKRLSEIQGQSNDETVSAAIDAQVAPIRKQLDEMQKRADEAAVVAMRPPMTIAGSAAELSSEEQLERTGGFANFGELVRTIRFEGADPRLAPLHDRAMSMGVGAGGGYLVPAQFVEMLTAIQPQDAIVRPRAQVIPAGDSPDATVTIPADDQSGTKGVYSGVTVVWTGEGADKTETEPALRQLELSPKEVSAYTVLSDKLLRNAAAAGPYVENKLRAAILAAEDVAFITGTGVAQPLGFLGHASAINVARAGAGLIAYADCVNMYANLLIRQGSPIWIGNPTVLPQLMQMVDAGNHVVWQPNAREGEPPMLMGLPWLRNERQPVLGTAGDLMLVNLLYYVIKDGAAMTIDVSPHVHFLKNQSVVKVVWNVDGQPTLNSPLLLEDGTTMQSPFVILN